MHFYLSLIKQFFLLLLTGESPKIKHWRADMIRPIQGIPFNVEWQVECALFVKLKGYKKRLPTSGAMLIKVEGPSTELELEAIGLFSVSKSTLLISCGDTVALKYEAIKDFSGNSQIKKLSSPATMPKRDSLTISSKPFLMRIAPKSIRFNHRIRLFQSSFDAKELIENDQGTMPKTSNLS